MLVDGWRREGSVGGGELTDIHLSDITLGMRGGSGDWRGRARGTWWTGGE